MGHLGDARSATGVLQHMTHGSVPLIALRCRMQHTSCTFLSAITSQTLTVIVRLHNPPTLFRSAGLPTHWIDRCPSFGIGVCCRKLEGLEGVSRSTAMATTTEQTQQSPKQLERKAAAKEEIVNATSGAREIVDHAAFNARAVGKILLHPFNKEAKQEAIATAREDKAMSGQRMAAIRDVGAQQADALRLSARAVDAPEAVQSGTFRDADAKPAREGAATPAVEDRENL